MSDRHGLTVENLMRTLPVYMLRDKLMIALAQATAEKLAELPEQVDRISIYANIDKLPADLLDILAYDFKVDWWDANHSVETKRQVLKDSWAVRRTNGTVFSLKAALGSIYPRTEVQEWFDYGGEPFHFRLILDLTQATETADYFAIMRAARYYKRMTAHLDEVVYQTSIILCAMPGRDITELWAGRTGTYNAGTRPYRNVATAAADSGVVNAATADPIAFEVPAAGTLPHRNVTSAMQGGGFAPATSADGFMFSVPRCGTNITKG